MGDALVDPSSRPLSGTAGTWQLTELSIQINMLSEEVKRLQDVVIPQSTQSTNSGMTTNSGSSGNRTPPAGRTSPAADVQAMGNLVTDPRSFEQKVAGLQNELK